MVHRPGLQMSDAGTRMARTVPLLGIGAVTEEPSCGALAISPESAAQRSLLLSTVENVDLMLYERSAEAHPGIEGLPGE